MDSIALREKSVDLEESGAGRVVGAANDGGVGAGGERDEDGGFVVVGWSERRSDDFLFLIRAPVVVLDNEGAFGVVELEERILKRVRDAGLGEGRTNGAKDERRW
jgi:hypothetical protein